MTDPGINVDDLRQAFELPNEFAEAVARLVLTDGLLAAATRAACSRSVSGRSMARLGALFLIGRIHVRTRASSLYAGSLKASGVARRSASP